MKLKLYTKTGPSEKEITLSPVFEESLNEKQIAEYINYVRNAMRKPIANTKDRSEVRGGGKKPWRQKGTGHARVGSSRSPLWVGGGVTFGPSNDQNFSTRLNKKFRSKARSSVFAHFAKNKRLLIIDTVEIKDAKTKSAEKLLAGLNLEGKISLFLAEAEAETKIAYRNLPYVSLMSKNDIDVITLVSCDYIVMTKNAYEEMFEGKVENVDK
jgi:large subunit ribosomal protein L4